MAIVSRVLKRKKLPLFDRTTVSPFSIHNVDKHRALEVIHLWILHAANGTINWGVRENKKRLKSELDYWLAINNNVRMRMSKRTIVHFISPVFLCAVSSFFVPLSFWNIWSNKARVSNVHVCLTSSTFEIGAHLFVLRGIICTDLDHFLVYFHRFGPSNHYSCGLLPLYCCFYLLFFSPFSFSFFFCSVRNVFAQIFWQWKSHSLFIITWNWLLLLLLLFFTAVRITHLEYLFFALSK